ncbi:MAG: putative hydro-lyase [Dehalococcoidia bacterium]
MTFHQASSATGAGQTADVNPKTGLPQTGAETREAIRQGRFRQPTSGVAPDFVQTNVAILPRDVAFEFLLFCQRNPKPCPVIEVLEPGQVEATLSAPGSDIRTDVPLYRVYQRGELVHEPEDILGIWRDDLVTFLLGCSFSFEHALLRNGIALPYFGTDKNVSMFRTNIPTNPAGPFSGPMVVTQRWIPREKVVRAVQATSRFPAVHGAPIHIGDPSQIGIADPLKPDFGDPWPPSSPDDVPVYWACGVTPQAVAMSSKPELMITHSPGHMFVTDLKDEDLAVL